MKMIMLSYEKIKMTLKNKQQEEQKTRWRACTSRKTQDTIVQTRNKKKEMKQTSTSTWSVHHKHKTIESDNDNALKEFFTPPIGLLAWGWCLKFWKHLSSPILSAFTKVHSSHFLQCSSSFAKQI
jgi:hypothetical protein